MLLYWNSVGQTVSLRCSSASNRRSSSRKGIRMTCAVDAVFSSSGMHCSWRSWKNDESHYAEILTDCFTICKKKSMTASHDFKSALGVASKDIAYLLAKRIQGAPPATVNMSLYLTC